MLNNTEWPELEAQKHCALYVHYYVRLINQISYNDVHIYSGNLSVAIENIFMEELNLK